MDTSQNSEACRANNASIYFHSKNYHSLRGVYQASMIGHCVAAQRMSFFRRSLLRFSDLKCANAGLHEAQLTGGRG